MQIVLSDRRTYIKTIEFRNTTPIVNVERLRSFKEEGVTGNFVKKEFRYSFDNTIWSPWQTLNSTNFTSISFLDQQHFYIHIKYTRSGVISGNINSFYITYDSASITHISPLDSSIINADLLQGADASYYLDLANHFGTAPFVTTYIDGSLEARDISIHYLDASLQHYIPSSSLGNEFYYLSGLWHVDIIDVSSGLSLSYIDGSFNARDISISWLNDNKSPSDHLHNNIYVKESSVGKGLVWDLSGGIIYLDISVGDVNKAYVDGSLLLRDISIQNVYNYVTNLSTNLSNSKYLKEASINFVDFKWDNTSKLSLSKSPILDPSYNYLYNLIIENSTNIGGLNYSSSFFVTPGQDLTVSVANLDLILSLLAPEKPETLSGKDLDITGSAVYDAILPSGLSSMWYYDDLSTGSLIDDYSIDNKFRLTTPNFDTSAFRSGFFIDSATRGVLSAYINDVLAASYDMTLGFGNAVINTSHASGILRFNNEAGYGGVNSNFWRKSESYIEITSQIAGGVKYKISHTEALDSNEFNLRYDSSPGLAKFSVSPTILDGAVNSVYLSGIEHYGINSEILLSFTTVPGIFKNAYHPTHVARAISTYGSIVNINPLTVPSYNDQLIVTNKSFIFNNANLSSGAGYPTVQIQLFKPNISGDSSTLSLTKRVNTYSITRSSSTSEFFTDEQFRLLDASIGGDTDWDSTDSSIFNPDNGPYAQVQNGTLKYPVSADYSNFTFSGTDKTYMRRFTKISGSLSNGILTFTGLNPIVDISTYGTGDLNMLMWLTDQNIYYDLALEYGTGGTGVSENDAKGVWISRGNTNIAWSLGTDSLGNESGSHKNTFVLIIIFRNINKSVTQIILT